MRIDTIQQKTEQIILDINQLEKLKKETAVMWDSKKTYQCDYGMKVAFKPSYAVNEGKELISCKDNLKIIDDVNIKYGLNDDISTIRIDFAIDYIESLLNRKEHKRFKLLLECLRLKRKWTYEISVLKIENKNRNIKISSKHIETTAYFCEDKDRETNGKRVSTRLENRYLNLQGQDKTKDIKELAIDKLHKMLEEFQGLEQFVEQVEDLRASELSEEFLENKGILYRDFSSFIEVQDNDNLILTNGLLQKLLINSGLKINHNIFRTKFNKTRTGLLTFTTKTEIKEMCNEIVRKIKTEIKELEK